MNSQDKSTPTIGIVIPIYNVAPYLRECLDSVANQTYKKFHTVLVNDGSTDNSKEIALEYVAKDSRFTLIDKENGGLSSARNAGIKYFSQIIDSALSTQEANSSIFDEKSGLRSHEQGNRTSRSLTKRVASLPDLSQKDEEFVPKIDYIIFLDSDDFWEVDLLEKCIKDIENAEVLLFDIDTFYDGLPPPSSNLQSIA